MGVGWGELWGLLGLAAVGVYVLWGPSTRASRRKGLVPGLRNIGSACYLNALLQALATCAPLHAWLQGAEMDPDTEEPGRGADERAHDDFRAGIGVALAPGADRGRGAVACRGDADGHGVDAGFSGSEADAHSDGTDAHSSIAEARGVDAQMHAIDADARGPKADACSVDTDTRRIIIDMSTRGVKADSGSDNTYNANIQSINTETHNTDLNTHSINTDIRGKHTDGYSNSTRNSDPNSVNMNTNTTNAHLTNGDTHRINTRDADAQSIDVRGTNGDATNPGSMDTDVVGISIESVNTQNTHSSSVKTDNDEHDTDIDTRTVNGATSGQDSETQRLGTDKRSNNNTETDAISTDTHCTDTQNTHTHKGGTDTDAQSSNGDVQHTSADTHPTSTGTNPSNTNIHPTNTDTHPIKRDIHPTSIDRHPANIDAHSTNTITRAIDTATHVTGAETQDTGVTDTHSSNTCTCHSDTEGNHINTGARSSHTIPRDINVETHSADKDTRHSNMDRQNKDARHANTHVHCSNADRRGANAETHGGLVPACDPDGAGVRADGAAASSAFEGLAFDIGEDPAPGSGRFIVRRSSEPSARERRPPGGHLHSALLGMLRVLMGEADAVDAAPVHAGPVLEALRSHGWEIPAYQEQDAHELFAVVMTTLEEERQARSSLAFSGLQLQKLPKWESAGVLSRVTGGLHVPLAKARASPFLGRFAITLQCTRCRHKGPVMLESFESISLHIPPNVHAHSVPLELCLERFFRSELLTGVKCDACSQAHPAGGPVMADFLKRTLLAKLPPCVCIHLHRLAFSRDVHAYKEHGHVSFRSSLDLARYTLHSELSGGRTDPCNNRYTLTAVVVHYGNSTSGHFVTYRSIPSGGRIRARWVCCSDDEVRAVSLSEVLNSRAYLLFYTRT